jgi:hypothetical protein
MKEMITALNVVQKKKSLSAEGHMKRNVYLIKNKMAKNMWGIVSTLCNHRENHKLRTNK